MRQKFSKYIWLFIIAGVGLWLLGVNEPYVGSYAANQNYFTLASKNFHRFGYIRLKFLPTYYSGGDLTNIPDFYLHHPILYFILVSLPFLIFSYHDWVSGVVPIIFSLFSLIWLYKIGVVLKNRQFGLWTAFFASIFPIMTVFSKQTIFEPAVLSTLLAVYYFFLSYLKYRKKRQLILLTGFSLLAILIDWGGAYFILPFLFCYRLFPKSEEKKKAIPAYIISIMIGTSLFFLLISIIKGNFADLVSAISVRAASDELILKNLPFLRLLAVFITRLVIYFTPLSIIGLTYYLYIQFKNWKKREVTLINTTILFFFIFGISNYIFLPTASFGHIYFLIYFVPFFALILSILSTNTLLKVKYLPVVILILVFIPSIFVTFFKWKQIAKQRWRYNDAYNINKELKDYEVLAVKGFPGDIFEQYFFHPTINFNSNIDLLEWLIDNNEEKKAVYSCWGDCSEDDLDFISLLPYQKKRFLNSYLINNNEADVLDESRIDKKINSNESQNIILKYYRSIRDRIGVGDL